MGLIETIKETLKASKQAAEQIITNILTATQAVLNDTQAVFGEIVLGVSMMITGLATLFVGNYIIFAIVTSLPQLASAGYNTTLATLTTYANTIIPIFGLCFLVAGFALILYTLRVTGSGAGQR
jgi:uncharacterized membrane-anchored protein YitT (DUF2179 family)